MAFSSMVFYSSWYETAGQNGKEFQAKMVEQLLRYGLYGEIPDNDSDPLAKMMFDMAKPSIDSNIKKKIYGKKGGASRGNQNAKKQKQPMVEAKTTYGSSYADAYVNAYADAYVNEDSDAAPFLTSLEASQSEPEMVEIDVSKLKGRGNK